MNLIQTAAKRTGITVDELIGTSRKHNILMVRQCVMWLMRTRYRMFLTDIGKHFDRDHTTVINAITRVNNYLHTKDEVYLPIHETVVIGHKREGGMYCYDCDGIIVQNLSTHTLTQ